MERLYRTWPGLLPLYLLEIWWALEIRPSREHRAHLDKRGNIVVDPHCQTSIPGLYAVGDVVSALDQIAVATGHAAIAATAIHNRLRRLQHE